MRPRAGAESVLLLAVKRKERRLDSKTSRSGMPAPPGARQHDRRRCCRVAWLLLDPPWHEPEPVGDRCRLGAVGGVELAEDVRDVDAGGARADVERVGDLPVVAPRARCCRTSSSRAVRPRSAPAGCGSPTAGSGAAVGSLLRARRARASISAARARAPRRAAWCARRAAPAPLGRGRATPAPPRPGASGRRRSGTAPAEPPRRGLRRPPSRGRCRALSTL